MTLKYQLSCHPEGNVTSLEYFLAGLCWCARLCTCVYSCAGHLCPLHGCGSSATPSVRGAETDRPSAHSDCRCFTCRLLSEGLSCRSWGCVLMSVLKSRSACSSSVPGTGCPGLLAHRSMWSGLSVTRQAGPCLRTLPGPPQSVRAHARCPGAPWGPCMGFSLVLFSVFAQHGRVLLLPRTPHLPGSRRLADSVYFSKSVLSPVIFSVVPSLFFCMMVFRFCRIFGFVIFIRCSDPL